MGKITGFMDYTRKLLYKKPPPLHFEPADSYPCQ